jgi:hypothetical protein
MSAATDVKYRQGWADGKADRGPDTRELAYGSPRLNSYERGYIDSGHFEVPREGGSEGSG